MRRYTAKETYDLKESTNGRHPIVCSRSTLQYLYEIRALVQPEHLINVSTPHCNTLQHTATHCNTLQHTATHCNTLQHTATHCNTLQQHTATHFKIEYAHLESELLSIQAVHCNNTLQHTSKSNMRILNLQALLQCELLFTILRAKHLTLKQCFNASSYSPFIEAVLQCQVLGSDSPFKYAIGAHTQYMYATEALL